MFSYEPPLKCAGCCVSCEERSLVDFEAKERLDLMSHGADTSDFEALLGPLAGPNDAAPVMFVLECPGGDYGNGEPCDCGPWKKIPPNRHYYFMPDGKGWPTSLGEVLASANDYGPYLAYLIRRWGLRNAYFTNLVKCRYTQDDRAAKRPNSITENCFREFLLEEITTVAPHVIFVFSDTVKQDLTKLLPKFGVAVKIATALYHPAAYRQYKRMTREEMLISNDATIKAELSKTNV